MGNYALLIVFSLTFALITYGDMTRKNLYQSETELIQTYNSNQAKNIAQSVAMVVISKLNDSSDKDYDTNLNQTIYYPSSNNYEDWDAMGGSYKVILKNQGDSLLLLETFGVANNQKYSQNIVMQKKSPTWMPDLPYAVFSGSSITLTGSAKLKGHVGTNATNAGAVNLDWDTRIDSMLMIGPGGDPSSTVIQANSSGNVGLGIGNLPSPAEYELPKFIDYPPKTVVLSKVTMDWSNTGLILTPAMYDGAYIPSINIPGDYTLNIDTGTEDRTLYVGDLNISQGHLNVTGSGNLTIIAENNLVVTGSSTVNNNTEDSERVMMYYGGSSTVDLGGATKFYGSIYAKTADVNIGGSGGIQGHIITGGTNVTVSGAATANTRVLFAPNAHVEVTGSGSIKGSVIADSFTASGAAIVTFSSAMSSSLPELVMEDAASGYSILSWY